MEPPPPAGGRDCSDALLQHVRRALDSRTPLYIRGGDSKARLGREVEAQAIDTRQHRGIVSYDPNELVITARAGTPVRDLLAALDAAGQMLPCEPPQFAGAATLGGMVASGWSGPRRPWAGAVRDFILGSRLITGHGTHLRFGGEVMKNVAGYDLSRLLAGSFGCLGLITEVSLKVLPKPRQRSSLCLHIEAGRGLRKIVEWNRQGLPVTAACHTGEVLYLRLEGGAGSVASARDRIGGETVAADSFWEDLREHKLAFFNDPRPLWRLSLPAGTALLDVPGAWLLDWGGAQRWLKTAADGERVRGAASAARGHATCFTPSPGRQPFHPLPAPLLRYHMQLKAQLDPQGIFNPGRMYAEF
jgi:glycolate oxidase FAD binding subunit